MSRTEKIQAFILKHCGGAQYDSCKNSPCPYASPDGCRHSEHPTNKE